MTTAPLTPPEEALGASAQVPPPDADAYGMTAPTKAPRITAADLKAAATRLAGVVVLDVADLTIRPALFDAKAGLFTDLDGELLGEDDGTLIVLVEPGLAGDLIAEHGAAYRAAEAATRSAKQVLR